MFLFSLCLSLYLLLMLRNLAHKMNTRVEIYSSKAFLHSHIFTLQNSNVILNLTQNEQLNRVKKNYMQCKMNEL